MPDPLRVTVSDAPVRPDGRYVLLWMTAQRRTRWNPALDHALARARALGRPLLVFEPLRLGYRWASVRHHAFVVDGMRDNAARCAAAGVTYLPWVEPTEGAGKGLLAALAAHAALVVADDAPLFFLPRMLAAAKASLPVRVEAVDGCGVLPLAAHEGRVFPFAHAFRRHLQKTLPRFLDDRPTPDPLGGYDLGRAEIPAEVAARWPAADLAALAGDGVVALGLDRTVGRVPFAGGPVAGEAALRRFLDVRLARYDERNDPDADVASGLSPYLHWGHVSAWEVVAGVLDAVGWTPDRIAPKPTGQREGWWGAGPVAEGFLDELITWRELGWGAARHDPEGFESYAGLPAWARDTLAKHAADPRPHRYDRDALEQARTHDEIWNAAQRELRATGRMHNYLRMLWAKKVLEWSASPAEAFDVLVELNNRWSVDGRDPNSYAGIGWTFGRFDRPWAPERPIFGTVRYMSSDATRKKLAIRAYLERWAAPGRSGAGQGSLFGDPG